MTAESVPPGRGRYLAILLWAIVASLGIVSLLIASAQSVGFVYRGV